MSRYRSPLSTFRIFPILCATFFAMAAMAAPVGFWPSGQGVDFPRTGPVADAPGFSFGGDTTEVVSTSEVCATDPATGLVMRQRRMWLPELGVARVETELINPGSAAVEAGDVLLVDWRFQVLDTQDGTRYRDLTYRNDVWYGSTYWTGPDWTRVGLDWHHPGENTPSVRRFTAPRDGRVSIAGRAFKADTNCGDGVRLTIRLRAEMVWEAEIDAADTAGVEPALTLDVKMGDALRFIVHKRGEIACDTTRWDPVVTYDDGTRYQASQGFSAVLQAGGAWSYEMEVDPDATVRLPVIHGFARDASLYEVTPSVNTPVSIEDGLPLAVLSDADDASGIAILVDSAAAWRLDAALDADGGLRFAWSVGERTVGPGGTRMLPVMYQGRYEGTWTAGMAALERLRGKMPELRGLDGDALPELDYWAMIQADWRKQDGIDGTLEAYRVAIGLQRAKTRALLNDLRASYGPDWLSGAERELDILDARQSVDEAGLRALYLDVRTLKRRIALANPLMPSGPLLFCKRVPTSYSHLVMQYYGWRARSGGGLFVLEQPGHSLEARDILDGALDGGNVLEPRLSYDARRIVFSYVACTGKEYDPLQLDNTVDEAFYHVYEVNVDGTGLRQLTSGPYDDVMPTYLPDGGIAFCSTRRCGYARCFGPQFSPRWDTYTVHRMDADGGNLHALSVNDVNEWFPTVGNDGMLLYARWDYIDRDAVTHQNLWAMRPDGANPMALWGNASPVPHCTFQIQPVPDSTKIVFTASAHHSIAGGSIALVDPSVDNNRPEAITRITPEIPFPEAEGRDIFEYYDAPWPLSERYFLVSYSPTPLIWEPGANERNALGIYLLDAAGNRELVYRDPLIGSTNPCPLVPRRTPPVLASSLDDAPEDTGEVLVANVYEGLGDDVPRIQALRIVQIFPKTTPIANTPPIGLAGEENARAVLGTVPVEPDGSARFFVPARTPILFQALDEDGFAYQTMRSLTYLQPGEKVSCIGCHEHRFQAPPAHSVLAARRHPSNIAAGPFDGRPFSFMRVVQPVLDEHCGACHSGEKPKADRDLTGEPRDGFTRSYWSLCGGIDFNGPGTNLENAAGALVPRFGARNQLQVTPPGGAYGARGSRLIAMLRKGHHDVELNAEELGRIGLWIDCNAVFYGAYAVEDQAKQLGGNDIGMPEVQ